MKHPYRCRQCGHVQTPPGLFVANCPECNGTNWEPLDDEIDPTTGGAA